MEYKSYPLTERVPCAFCGADDPIAIDYPEKYGTGARLAICKRCGLGYLIPRWSTEDYGKFYEREYRALVSHQTVNLSDLARGQHIHAGQVLHQCSTFIERGSQVLDIGCSTGTLLNTFKHNWGCDVYGVDPSVNEANFAKSQYDISVFVGLFEDFRVEGQTGWDLIVNSQTFNHLLDPGADLRKIWDLLKPRGKLFLEVQNFPEFAKFSLYPIKVDHTYYFWPETLIGMLMRFGFSPVRVSIDTRDSYMATPLFISSRVPSIHIHVLAEKTTPQSDFALPDGRLIANNLVATLDAHRHQAFFQRMKSTAHTVVGDRLYQSARRILRRNH